nr:hypothetical protein [Chlamydiota bacterium]
ALDKSQLPELDISDIKLQGGLLSIPKEKLKDSGISSATGTDKFGRKFFVMHIRDKKAVEKTSILTLHQRYDNTDSEKLWILSQNFSFIQSEQDDPGVKGTDIKKIASILMGTHLQYELVPTK